MTSQAAHKLETHPVSEAITSCRACGAAELVPFLDLGTTPLADRLLTDAQLQEPEILVPLEVVFCTSCTLVQITETVRPEILFCEDYPYYSSVSKRLLEHFRGSADRLIDERGLDTDSLVVEAASNDGYMLERFVERGIPCLGIDPAEGPAQAAEQAGVPTLNSFFGLELARRLRSTGRRADLFLANNVLAHVPDLNGFVEGIATLLKEDGVAVIECPYLLDLVDNVEFDTIYHQHLCYFSVTALDRLFRRHGLHLNRAERTSIHGGSLRLFVEPTERVESSVHELLRNEQAVGADQVEFYRDFSERVHALRTELARTLEELRRSGARIAGYGAAAKACTLMSFCGIDASSLEFIADLNAHKHGRYMGGNRLRIVPPSRLLEDPPDYVLVLAWNFADEIIEQQQQYRRAGGRFIVPIPEVRLV